MVRYRITEPAKIDLANIIATSLERWGTDAKLRYKRLLVAAIRSIAGEPHSPLSRDRSDLRVGVRSFHLRHTRATHGVKTPAHVVFYRQVGKLVEIVRIMHDRMDPALHLDDLASDE